MPPVTSIPIHSQAPSKPGLGEPCSGCGVCCLLEPCPLGVFLSGRRTGACEALRWQADARLYRCGAVAEPEDVLRKRLPVGLTFAAPAFAALLRRVAYRWIAAGVGCDCDAELATDPVTPDGQPG